MGASWLLPRLVGLGRAAEILMLGDFVEAREAERIGLYNRVVPAERVLPEATALAERLARGPAFGLEVTKRMLLREAAMDVESAMAAETEIQAACMLHPDFREAYEAFKAKREPRFK
jgi:enoyl-CoA hydratase/carnithine racemase